MSYPLHQAIARAEKIRDALAQYCTRIAIAGSIRRARETVNDIDLVAEPKDGIANADGQTYNQAMRLRCRENAHVIREGAAILHLRAKDGCQIDIYFATPARKDLLSATPGNWGSILLCRTGSKEHNVKVCQAAQKLGLKWKTMVGLCEVNPLTDEVHKVLASETEEDILKHLGLGWIPPVSREVV